MVNFVAALKLLIKFFMKMFGVHTHLVEIMPGTIMNFWMLSETLNNPKTNNTIPTSETNIDFTKTKKPVVVLVHGFAGDGILTWMLQVRSLTKQYSVYIPDLLFSGDSFTNSSNRSPDFQAECLVKGLKKLGVERCTVVGFSYGGLVAFKMAELYPDFVEALVVLAFVVAMSHSISDGIVQRLGVGSFADMLLPTSLDGVKALLSLGAYRKIWLPYRIYMDYLEVMINNRKERRELLDGMIVSDKDGTIPIFKQISVRELEHMKKYPDAKIISLRIGDITQLIPDFVAHTMSEKIHLPWGEEDEIFKFELAKYMKELLGDLATYQGIKKAGHLVHIETPFIFNKRLIQFLNSMQETDQAQ